MVAFRAAASGYNNAGTSVAALIPASVQPGDLILAFAAISDVTLGDPGISGGGGGGTWSPVGAAVDDASLRTRVWSRIAVAGDAGAAATATWTTSGKGGLIVAAYSDVHPTSPVNTFATAVEAATDTTHDCPGVTPTAGGCWVVEFVSDRGTAATTITAPGSRTERAEQLGSGSGTVDLICADSNAAVAQGVATGVAPYTYSSALANAVGWSLAIRPPDSRNRPAMASTAAVNRAANW
jgi:large repetitive protein